MKWLAALTYSPGKRKASEEKIRSQERGDRIAKKQRETASEVKNDQNRRYETKL